MDRVFERSVEWVKMNNSLLQDIHPCIFRPKHLKMELVIRVLVAINATEGQPRGKSV